MGKKPHLSPTQLDMFLKCPEQYRRRYVEGEIIPPAIALLKGRGFHKGAEVNFQQKIETHEDLPKEEIRDAAVSEFEGATSAGEVWLSEEERSKGYKNVIGETTDSLAEAAEIHADTQAPDYQPVLVEEYVTIELPQSTHDLLGKLDLADERGVVADFKTGGRKKRQEDADTNTGLTVYGVTYHARTGKQASGFVLDSVIQTKTRSERQALHTQRLPADYQALVHRINAVSQAINAGLFPPAPPDAWWCSERYCGYYTTCPFVRAGVQNRQND